MYNRLQKDIVTAMKEKNDLKKNLLRGILAIANSIAKDAKTDVVTDDMVLTAIKKELKQQKQSLEAVEAMPDSEFYKLTELRINILETEYMPKQLSEDELRTEIAKFIEDNNLKALGKGAMKNIMPVFKDKADGKMVNKIASELLV